MGALQRIDATPDDAGSFGALDPRNAWQAAPSPVGGDFARTEILGLLDTQAQQHPLNHALAVATGGQWRGLTYSQLARRVRWMADDLGARFPRGGQPIAILAESGPAWGIAALAVLASRNVLVPLDTSADVDTLAIMLNQVAPAVVLTSIRYEDTVRRLTLSGAPVGVTICLGDPFVHVDIPLPCELEQSALDRSTGSATNAPAVMAFTSGTTGEPKAVELSFESLLFEVRALTRDFALRPSDRLLSVLPMHHMLEFTAGFLCPLWCGAEIYYLQSLLPEDALREIRACGISRMVVVPAWLSLLKRQVEHRVPWDQTTAQERSSWKRTAARSRARQALGPDLEHFVCGGAPLAAETAEFFDELGVPVLQGYGLTETGPVVSTNTTRQSRRGSVGRPLPGTEARIATDGEILVRGPHVASRYHVAWDVPAPVADDDGWLHTGDLGHFDEDGFLYVTGRSKSTIVLASGKNVQPEEVEACLEGRTEIDDVGVVGLKDGSPDGAEEICAVVTASSAFAERCRTPGDSLARALRRVVDETTRSLAAFKRPKHVVVSRRALPRTATGKLRRAALTDWASSQMDGES